MSKDTEYTSKEVAARLKVSVAYVRQLCIAKRLQGHKLGRDWRVKESELLRFEQARKK